jgi:uncharacterized protein (DUF3084 family)
VTDSTTDAAALAVVVARLDDLRAQVAQLSTLLAQQQQLYVPRTEWELWRENANRELRGVHEDIEGIESAAEARHPSWTSVAASIAADAALALSIITRVSP